MKSTSNGRLCDRRRLVLLAACGLSCSLTSLARSATDNAVVLQWFECSWSNIENRMPDAFMAGYGATWIPAPWKASDGSAGYDTFDRFDLGSPSSPTMYGTERAFATAVKEFKLAGIDVYPELIMNHNGARTTNAQFVADGGWPGFYLPNPPSNWGDFHDGTTQSFEPNPQNGTSPYDLWKGDLVSLCDISQESNNVYVRHPTTASAQSLPGAQPSWTNIPPGNVRNRPDPNNARFYPDKALTPVTFTNPADNTQWTLYPFNTANPLAGDPYPENVTGMLMRSIQWMMDTYEIDGWRLDAAKHIPQWFWNNYYDPIVYNRRKILGVNGANQPITKTTTAYSFGESVSGNDFIQTYVRKDGFGYRDALDLNEAGALRDLLTGFGIWGRDPGQLDSNTGPLERSFDTQDNGQNDGSQGVHHTFSHDNGSTGNGTTAPGTPTRRQQGLVINAYVLFRPGLGIIYHNAREMHTRFQTRGFWPREGSPTALGNATPGDGTDAGFLTKLLSIHNGWVRGNFSILNRTDTVNQSIADVLMIQRGNNTNSASRANLIASLNKRWDAGTDTRNVVTNFAPGTVLVELTGNAADPIVDPTNAIPDTVTVDNNQRVTIVTPRNKTGSTEHGRGYVVYGLQVPSAALTTANIVSGSPTTPLQLPAETGSNTFAQRITPVDVINTPTFQIRVNTSVGAGDSFAVDDFACFRIDQGFKDYTGNGVVDLPSGSVDTGYEVFSTTFNPLYLSTNGNGTYNIRAGGGVYAQTIDTSLLSEGFHYITVNVYRRRTDGGLAVFNELRRVIYVDRSPAGATINTTPISGNTFAVNASDRTANKVYLLANPGASLTDSQLYALCNTTNLCTKYDRLEWRRNVGTLPAGTNQLVAVVLEPSPNPSSAPRYNVIRTNFQLDIGSGDVNQDGVVDINDLYSLVARPNASYIQEGDLNRNAVLDTDDRVRLEDLLRKTGPTTGDNNEAAKMRGGQR